MQEKAGQPFPG